MFGEDGFDLIKRPVATTTFVSRIHLRNLGDEIRGGIKAITSSNAFSETVQLIVFPCRTHAVGDNSVHDRGSCPRFSFKIGGIELCGLDCKIRRGIERIVEADVSESVSHPLSPFCLPSGSIFCSCRSLFSRYFYIKPRGYFDISHFILRRIIKSCNEFPEKPAPCRERNVWTDSPETPQTRLAERGQPMSRWYPCRISCKPSQGPPMRGTCPPQRPGEGIEFESGWAEPHPGSLADGFPAGRGKRFGKEAPSIGARNETRRFYCL